MIELIVISPETTFPHETEWVHKMMAAGLKKYHVRKPLFSIAEQQHYLGLYDTSAQNQLVVHQHQAEALQSGFKHVHIKAQERQQKKLMGLWPSCSTSFHQVEEVASEGTQFAYAFLSPIFDSLSKPNYKATSSLIDQVQDTLAEVYALGGVVPERIAALKGKGFTGVAALGYVWQKNPLDQFLRLQEACHAL